MKTLIRIISYFAVLIAVVMLKSCATNTNVIHLSNFTHTKKSDSLKLEKVQIVKVIDDRLYPNTIIGYIRNKDKDSIDQIIIDKPLAQYLKENFNTLISKDYLPDIFIPVTVHINEFYSSLEKSMALDNVYHKYSYSFEYPNDSNRTNKIQILDSLYRDTESPIIDLESLIYIDLLKTSISFIDYYNNNKSNRFSRIAEPYTNTMKYYTEKDKTEGNYVLANTSIKDTLDLTNSDSTTKKKGGYFSYYQGYRVKHGIGLNYVEMHKWGGTNLESGIGLGLKIFDLKPKDSSTERKFILVGGESKMRYNFSENINGLFFDICSSLIIGFEFHPNNNNQINLCAGLALEESIGVYFIKPISISIGTYQKLILGSKIMPNDYGLVLSFCITSAY